MSRQGDEGPCRSRMRPTRSDVHDNGDACRHHALDDLLRQVNRSAWRIETDHQHFHAVQFGLRDPAIDIALHGRRYRPVRIQYVSD